MHTKHTIGKSIAIFATAALVLNAIAPTLAHAAESRERHGHDTRAEDCERFVGERARQVAVAKGRYVNVTYRKDDGEIETAEGFVRERDETELTIRRGLWEKKIPLNGIDVLIVCDNPSQLQRAKRVSAIREREGRKAEWYQSRRFRIAKKSLGALAGGSIGSIGGYLVGAIVGNIRTSGKCNDNNLECLFDAAVGMGIGFAVGVPIGVSKVDPHDRFSMTMAGGLLGAGVGILMSDVTEGEISPSFCILPLVGATIMSEASRPLNTRRFSGGLAPDRDGNVLATATLRF